MTEQKKYIFIDLDNTLIIATPNYVLGNDQYDAHVRPGAKDLLRQLRNIAPTFLLTAAAGDYARVFNTKFNLGFKDKDIYSRDDTLSELSLFKPKGICYLIDNLPEENHKSQIKINFLRNIGPVNYVQIKSYNGLVTQALTSFDIKNIVDQIV